jgi:hypothetical protein
MKLTNIVIHNSVTNGGDVEFMRDIHLRLGYRDVGYHRIVCNGKPHGDWPAGKDGEVQKGRKLDDDSVFEEDEVGAHARGFNRESIGICVIGNFEETMPTPKQIKALIALCTHLCRQFELKADAIIGHRDVKDNSTNCPGKYLYSLLSMIRMSVKYRLMLSTS